MYVLVLLVGFGLLIWGADHFVEGASSLAKKLGIPSVIVGLTVVAFGTSAPELAVSVTAGLNGSNEIALGNILGSNMFNLLVVVGMSSIIAPLVVDKDILKRDWVASIIATIALVAVMLLGGEVSQLDGALLLAGILVILAMQIRAAKKAPMPKEHREEALPGWKITLYILLGLIAIVAGGEMSVNGATEIARVLGLSETIIGLTVVALGTSLPELVTSLVATRRGETSMAIGNVIGSNLMNIGFILGTSTLINPITVQATAIYDTSILLAVSLWLFVLAKKGKLNRPWGAALLLTYALYMVWIVVR